MTRWKTLNFKTIKHEEEITGFFYPRQWGYVGR